MSTLLAATIGCADDPLATLQPQIVVDPVELDFGDGIIGAQNGLVLTIKNRGPGVLEISTVEVQQPGSIFSAGEAPKVVGGLAERPLSVYFTPLLPHEVDDATLVIHSNDPVRPALSVPLHGVGGVREIEVSPTEIDFGVVDEGTAPRRQIAIENLGGDPLVVSGLTWTSTSVDMDLVPGVVLPLVVAPNTSTVVELVYSPVDLGSDAGTLTIASNDEDEPRVVVHARGRANLAPRAIAWECPKDAATQEGCDAAQRVRELSAGFRRLVALDGRDAYDPEGEPLTFRWVLEAEPDQSNASIFHATSRTADIETDRVGTYRIRLIAKDPRGLESLVTPPRVDESIVTINPRDLEVLLRWDVGTDVDLHLVRPGGRVGDYGDGIVHTSTGTDCSAFNREPNWGDPTKEMDDPSLDKDDVTGRGPEVISLDVPEETGAYRVYAHYCDSRASGVPANATVEVYVRGALVATVPEVGGFALLPSELWAAADVTWNRAALTASVVPHVTSAPTDAPHLCFR